MRELTVFYCPRCGRYGFYQLVKNAYCHGCEVPMRQLDLPYQSFTHLNLADRDSLICNDIIFKDTSILNRITASDRLHNDRGVLLAQHQTIQTLDQENKRLNDTVEWMHALIWDLIRKNKALEHQLHPELPETELPGEEVTGKIKEWLP